MNSQRGTLTLLSFSATRRPVVRLVVLSGLLTCSLATALRAANNVDQFLEIAKQLIQAINSDAPAAVQAAFDTPMQQFLPPDKATPFFRKLIAGTSKLKE